MHGHDVVVEKHTLHIKLDKRRQLETPCGTHNELAFLLSSLHFVIDGVSLGLVPNVMTLRSLYLLGS